MFSTFAKWISKELGHSYVFMLALFFVLIWFFSGPYFDYSEDWQLVINTSTTIITFLMVFLIQNTQNRDTTALHLKLDEIIRSLKNSHNEMLKIEELSDKELDELLHKYEDLAKKIKTKKCGNQPDINLNSPQ